MSNPKSEVLHASLKEQPFLFSISQDPSSTLKINMLLCKNLFSKNIKEKEDKELMHREVKKENPLGY